MADQRTTARARGRGRYVQKKSNTGRWLLVGAVLLIIAGTVYLAITYSGGGPRPGTQFPDMGQGHVSDGTKVEYNSDPPTSGEHWNVPAPWGFHETAPPDERLVHNLEHGGVIISYNPERISAEDLQSLKDKMAELARVNHRVILTPREGLDSLIALTAWTYLQKLDSYDASAIDAFFDKHIEKGPECQRGVCPR